MSEGHGTTRRSATFIDVDAERERERDRHLHALRHIWWQEDQDEAARDQEYLMRGHGATARMLQERVLTTIRKCDYTKFLIHPDFWKKEDSGLVPESEC